MPDAVPATEDIKMSKTVLVPVLRTFIVKWNGRKVK